MLIIFFYFCKEELIFLPFFICGLILLFSILHKLLLARMICLIIKLSLQHYDYELVSCVVKILLILVYFKVTVPLF